MAEIFFNMGKGRAFVEIPDSNLVGVHSPPRCEAPGDSDRMVRDSIAEPVKAEPIPSQIGRGEKALIVLDDITRETPIRTILPQITGELERAGVRDGDIEIIFALGTHRYMSPEEMEGRAGPEAVKRFKVFNHYWREEEMLRDLGTTSSGIPIRVNSSILEADWSIGVGSIAPHRVAGYTGGGKIVQPGLSGAETTGLTHYMSGKLEGEDILGVAENPVRIEMEEIAHRAGLKMIANAVLDGRNSMAGCFCGDGVLAHREGTKLANEIYSVPIDSKVDVAVVDSHPADIDMWQAVKALEAAELAVRPGGTIVMLTPCWEGISKEHPELETHGYLYPEEAESMRNSGQLQDLCSVAAMIHVGKIRERMRVIVYSIGLTRKEIETLGFEYAPSPQEAVDMALQGAGRSAEVLAFKRAAQIVPRLEVR